MKYRLPLLLLLACATLAQGQWYTGWSQQTGLALSLKLTDSLPQLYSPLQTAEPLPVSQCSHRGDTLAIECAAIGFRLVLYPSATDSCLHGSWRQGLIREVITFCPADTIYQLRRPQSPAEPFPYDEEVVTVDYVDSHGDSIHLEGTLTLPRSRRKVPALLLVSGSGQQNRDEELFYHRPFAVLADYLAREGIATLRYDDRGVDKSRGSLDSADTRTFADDAEAMFRTLRNHGSIDRRRLGIGGHSEGAAIAPMVAARNKDVRFVLMMAGQGYPGLDILLRQNEAIYSARGVADSLVALRLACLSEVFALPPDAPLSAFREAVATHTASLSPDEFSAIDFGRGSAFALREQMRTRWMQTFLRLDPAEYLPRVQCPILAIGGTLDLQVPAAENLSRIRELTQRRADCRLLPGLNHLFQPATTGLPTEYAQIEQTFDTATLHIIAEWILER